VKILVSVEIFVRLEFPFSNVLFLGACRYFLRKLKKVKKSNGQVLAINEVHISYLASAMSMMKLFKMTFADLELFVVPYAHQLLVNDRLYSEMLHSVICYSRLFCAETLSVWAATTMQASLSGSCKRASWTFCLRSNCRWICREGKGVFCKVLRSGERWSK
jgi:hypothetical protein